jgi:hypothetical protein
VLDQRVLDPAHQVLGRQVLVAPAREALQVVVAQLVAAVEPDMQVAAHRVHPVLPAAHRQAVVVLLVVVALR